MFPRITPFILYFKVSTGAKISAPIKGVTAEFGITRDNENWGEHSYSSQKGWSGSITKEKKFTMVKHVEVPPQSKWTVQMVMDEATTKRPYTAKYKLTYENGGTNIVEEEGTKTNVGFFNSRYDIVNMTICTVPHC